MLALLRCLTWPALRRNRLLFGLVILAVALGVAGYASLTLSDRALRDAFHDTLAQMAGRAQLRLATDGGVSETVLEEGRLPRCVASAAGVIERSVLVRHPHLQSLSILGVDLLEEGRFRDYTLPGGASFDDALVFLAQPDSLLIHELLARQAGLGSGARLEVWAGGGWKTLTVRGTFRPQGPASAWGSSLAVMDVYAAQLLFGRRGYFDRVDILVAQDTRPEDCLAQLRRDLGEGMAALAVPARGERLTDLSTTYHFLVDISGLLAVIVSLFLLHHGFLVAVTRREHAIGIVLSLGASSRQVLALVLAESLFCGLAGSALGIALGWASAHWLTPLLHDFILFSRGRIAPLPTQIALPLSWAALVMLTAGAMSALASWTAARRASLLPPIQLAERRLYQREAPRESRRHLLAAALLLLAAVLLPPRLHHTSGAVLAILIAAAGLALAAQTITAILLRALRPLFSLLLPLEGRLALDSLLRSLRRSKGMVVSLAVVIAALVSIIALLNSYGEELRRFGPAVVTADFLIHGSTNLERADVTYDEELLHRLRAVAGVARVAGLWNGRLHVAGRNCRLLAIDEKPWRATLERPYPPLSGGVAISDVLSRFTGLKPGDRIPIPTPRGPRELEIRFVYRDYLSSTGVVAMDRRLREELFADTRVTTMLVYLHPHATPADVRAALQSALPSGTPALIMDGAQFRRSIEEVVARWSNLSLTQITAALPLTMLGVVSFLLVSVAERRREFGILAALGARPALLARCVVTEALALAAAASVLGSLLALPLTFYLRLIIREMVAGFDLAAVFPWPAAIIAAGATALAAVAGAALPVFQLRQRNLALELEAHA